jgi:hypothetical protein
VNIERRIVACITTELSDFSAFDDIYSSYMISKLHITPALLLIRLFNRWPKILPSDRKSHHHSYLTYTQRYSGTEKLIHGTREMMVSVFLKYLIRFLLLRFRLLLKNFHSILFNHMKRSFT